MHSEIVDVVLPKLGESIVGATIVQWLKKEGDQVSLDEALVEVSTDKVNTEIPSPVAGILKEICVPKEHEIEVGALLARISHTFSDSSHTLHDDLAPQTGEAVSHEHCPHPFEGQSQSAERRSVQKKCEKSGLAKIEITSNQFVEDGPIEKTSIPENKEDIFSPAVLRLAHLGGISIDVLRTIDGTGEGGRITKKDVERFSQSRSEKPLHCQLGSTSDPVERIVMSGMRKAIAENMVRSFYEAPHASLVMDTDVTDVMKLIAREKERFLKTHGVKLTITSFLVQALTKSLQQFPLLNASVEGDTIVMKRYVNVGIAVNIDKGLIVPVIKNCQEQNLVSIAKAIADLSSRARASKLSPTDVTEGTVTLTNFGMTGALIGVPIIRYPEVAIIGAGTLQKRVVVRDDDSLAIRHMIYLTLTFDHRVIDGIYGCQFLASFKNHLESLSMH